MEIINLTKDRIVFDSQKVAAIEPSGLVPVIKGMFKMGKSLAPNSEIPILEIDLSNVVVRLNGLPFPAETHSIYYVVSKEVAEALPLRTDLLVPVFQNDNQTICQGLTFANPIPMRIKNQLRGIDYFHTTNTD